MEDKERDPPPLAKKFSFNKEDLPIIYIYFYDRKLYKKYEWSFFDERRFSPEVLMLWAEKERLRDEV